MNKDGASIHALLGNGSFIAIPFDSPQFEGVPPEGMATLASAPVWGTAPAFATYLQSFLNATVPSSGGPPILSKALWVDAVSDGLQKDKLSVGVPMLVTVQPSASNSWSAETTTKGAQVPSGWSMLQMAVNRADSVTGRKSGAVAWAGLANSYCFADPQSGLGGVLIAQFLPFADPAMAKLRDDFETLIYSSLSR